MANTLVCTDEQLKDIEKTIGEAIELKMGRFAWRIGMAFFASLIAVAVTWGALQQRVWQNEKDISQLRDGNTTYLTREQVTDMLGARDATIAAMQVSLQRIEAKIDKLSGGK